MESQTERMQILERIERGEISVDEGLSLIETLPDQESAAQVAAPLHGSLPEQAGQIEAAANEMPAAAESLPPGEPGAGFSAPPSGAAAQGIPLEAVKWKRFWIIPLWIGVALTALGGFLMYMAIEESGFGFWFICAALLFALGVVVISLAWQSQFSPWLHLRLQQRAGEYPQRIAFSFPLPVRPAAWFLRNFGGYIHGLDSSSLDEILVSIDRVTSSENPIYIQVDEGSEGEKVEIYIG